MITIFELKILTSLSNDLVLIFIKSIEITRKYEYS